MAKALPIPDVAPETPFGAFAARVIEIRAGEVESMLGAPSRNGAGAERVHDRRVALRRLRTAIEVFEPTLPKRAKGVRRDLKGAFSALGARRDADVAIEALRSMEPELADADRPGLESLVAAFDREGSAAAFDVDAALRAGEGAALLAERARERGGPPAVKALRTVARRRMAEVVDGLSALEDPRDADALHDLRIAAKRLRYVLEAAAPALGPAAVTGSKAARELQTVLGDIHDCDVLLPRVAAHRRALRAEDVAALRAGRRPPNATRYRGVQSVDTRLRARRASLREHAAGRRAAIATQLEAAATEAGLAS